jgi:Peptidase family M49
MRRHVLLIITAAVWMACSRTPEPSKVTPAPAPEPAAPPAAAAPTKADPTAIYAPVRLEADLSGLSDSERRMLPILIRASEIMDDLFWQNAYGDKAALMAQVSDPTLRKAVEINYGPWDRLNGDEPLLPGMGKKPPGANFYPTDMTKEEFEAAQVPDKTSLYTLLRRGEDRKLRAVPFREAFRAELEKAAGLLKEAAALAEDAGLRRYLELRARALVTDDYRASDMAWLDMKKNRIDVVIGPIETYEDALFGYKAAYEAYVLIKDLEWSKKLARYVRFLPALQRGLPVPAAYKRERPGSDSDLNAYDVLYYAGHANAGSKTIAINLPNDEKVQLAKGTRRLQLKNAMRAKFDRILKPIAQEIVSPDQMANITFEAFFANVMFHEVAHGLGIKNTINKRGTVREALKDYSGPLEEAKADILGLYMITTLFDKGEIKEGKLLDHYVTFLAGLLRSVRFGAANAHGRANMVEFNFLQQQGAFVRDEGSGTYKVDLDRMRAAVQALAQKILKLQGDGDYDGVAQVFREIGVVGPALKAELDRLGKRSIPVDIVFEQGTEVLGLGG